MGFSGLTPSDYGEGLGGGTDGGVLLNEGQEILGHGYLTRHTLVAFIEE